MSSTVAPPPPLDSIHYVNLIAACNKMNSSGINQGTSGNVSIRVEGGYIISPSGIPYETLTPETIPFVEMDEADENFYVGNKAPSSEWKFHRDIYQKFPKAKSIVHSHSTYATALSCLRLPIPAFHYSS